MSIKVTAVIRNSQLVIQKKQVQPSTFNVQRDKIVVIARSGEKNEGDAAISLVFLGLEGTSNHELQTPKKSI